MMIVTKEPECQDDDDQSSDDPREGRRRGPRRESKPDEQCSPSAAPNSTTTLPATQAKKVGEGGGCRRTSQCPCGGDGEGKPKSWLCIFAFIPAADMPCPGRSIGDLPEWEDERDEGAAVCSQGELKCHQAAAHSPVTSAVEEAEIHTSWGLLHVLHEAPAQVTLDVLIVTEGDKPL